MRPQFGRAVKCMELGGFAPCMIVELPFQAARYSRQSANAPEPPANPAHHGTLLAQQI